MTELPRERSATYDLLHAGYVGETVASTVALVRDGDVILVVDPGMVRDRELILGPLRALGVEPEAVTDVSFSHHHPDHTLNAALFPNARFHDHWAIYQGDTWDSRDADGWELSPSVRFVRTPGHTPEDITILIGTADGIVAFTHLWYDANTADDDFATDVDSLHAWRPRIIELADVVVPGHGPAFTPTAETPR